MIDLLRNVFHKPRPRPRARKEHYPAGQVFRGHFEAGLGNQLVVFQKIVCLAMTFHGFIPPPVLFHCDKTEARKYCDPTKTFPFSDLVTMNARVHKLITNQSVTRVIPEAYYHTDYCKPRDAFSFPDLVAFSPQVVAYGESLRQQCPRPCLTVHHRVGHDWEWYHATNLTKARVAAVVRRHRKSGCIILTPESAPGPLPCPRVRHAPNTTSPLRFFAEMYLAATADTFVYDRRSTVYPIVRRLAQPRLKMISLQGSGRH